jgi:hypothetical protein
LKISHHLVARCLLTSVALTAFSPMARAAAECAEDDDCDPGFVCDATCLPAPCLDDRDCAQGMVCAHQAPPVSTSAGCSPELVCDAAAPHSELDISQCAPRWALPCEIASDCGDGFDCTPQESGSGLFGCRVQSKACTSAVDCPADWTCAPTQAADCASEGGAPGASPGDAASGAPDDATSLATCDTSTAAGMCRPPFADQTFPTRGVGVGPGEGPLSTDPPPVDAGEQGQRDASNPQSTPSATRGLLDAGPPAAADAGTGSADTGKPQAPAPAPTSKREGGCSMAQLGQPAVSNTAWLIVLALGAAFVCRARPATS